MAEVLVQFAEPVVGADGIAYIARACGGEMPDGLWQGWIEFLPAGAGTPIRSGRETTQPNRNDTLYWATGLTTVYLEGALDRAGKAAARADSPLRVPPPVFDGPAEDEPARPAPRESILNPFAVYRRHGETMLRNQLGALSARHLVNIARAHELSEATADELATLPSADLVELITSRVRIPPTR